jgi:hypothetical protein
LTAVGDGQIGLIFRERRVHGEIAQTDLFTRGRKPPTIWEKNTVPDVARDLSGQAEDEKQFSK